MEAFESHSPGDAGLTDPRARRELSKLAGNWPETFWEGQYGTEADLQPLQDSDCENFFIVGPTR